MTVVRDLASDLRPGPTGWTFGGLALIGYGPAAASLGPLRRRLLPGLAGIGPWPRIALTYDDGPDPASTPRFLDLLDRHGVRAPFFLLGAHAARHPELVRRTAAAGHELAVHGWDHRCVVRIGPATLARQLQRTTETIEDLTGAAVRFYRPPYGVLTTPALFAARWAGLRSVLWSAWGRDWEARATPERVVAMVNRTLRPGGTVLLHDTDRTSAPGSWRVTLAASEGLLRQWSRSELAVGVLADHGLGSSPERALIRLARGVRTA